MTLIKICGITNKNDALTAADFGADMLGFIFYRRSKRYVLPGTVRDIVRVLPGGTGAAGVFVDEDPDEILRIVREAGLSAVQLHGNESPDECARFSGTCTVIKACRIGSAADVAAVKGYPVDYYLLDTFVEGARGGTGRAFDWSLLHGRQLDRPVILSGGLTPDTVGTAIRGLAPAGVDVSSGVERAPGVKDALLVERFISNVRELE